MYGFQAACLVCFAIYLLLHYIREAREHPKEKKNNKKFAKAYHFNTSVIIWNRIIITAAVVFNLFVIYRSSHKMALSWSKFLGVFFFLQLLYKTQQRAQRSFIQKITMFPPSLPNRIQLLEHDIIPQSQGVQTHTDIQLAVNTMQKKTFQGWEGGRGNKIKGIFCYLKFAAFPFPLHSQICISQTKLCPISWCT